MNQFKHADNLEYISLQLKAFSHTLDTVQSQFEIQQVGEEVIASYTTLKHSIDNIRAEIDKMIHEMIVT